MIAPALIFLALGPVLPLPPALPPVPPGGAAAALGFAPDRADGTAGADGEEGEGAAAADEIVVTGPRLGRPPEELPYRVMEIEAIGADSPTLPADIGDALADQPSISVQRTARGQVSPFLRGQTGFRVLTLVDGVRLNNAVYRDGPNQYLSLVDPWMLEGARVVHGPGSVLFGSDAVGGTLLLESRVATPDPAGLSTEGRLVTRGASAEGSLASRLESELSTPDFAVCVAGTYRDFDDLSGGRHVGLQPNTAHNEWNGDLSVAAPLSPTVTVTGMLQAHEQQDVPRTHATIHGISWRGTTVGSDLQRDLDQERALEWLRFDWDPAEERSVELLLSRHRLSETEERTRSNGRQQVQDFDDVAWGASLTWSEETRIGRVSTGVDAVLENVDSDVIEYTSAGAVFSDGPRGAVADDSSYDTYGIYIEDEIPLAEESWLTLGARFTNVSVDAEDVDPNPADANVISPIDESWSDVVGSARLRQRVSEAATAFIGVSQAFRAPNLSDLTRFDSARSGEFEVPSPDLDPEKFLTFELGGEWRLGRVRASGSTWYTILDGLIVRSPTGSTTAGGESIVTKENAGDGYTAGFEVGLDVEITREWLAGGSFAWMEGIVEQTVSPGVESDEPLSKMPPARGEVHLRFTPEAVPEVFVEARVRFADEMTRLSASDEADTQRIPPGGTPGYSVLDLRLAWQATDRLRLMLDAENVTDRDYRIHGSGSNEPGTNVALGVELLF